MVVARWPSGSWPSGHCAASPLPLSGVDTDAFRLPARGSAAPRRELAGGRAGAGDSFGDTADTATGSHSLPAVGGTCTTPLPAPGIPTQKLPRQAPRVTAEGLQ